MNTQKAQNSKRLVPYFIPKKVKGKNPLIPDNSNNKRSHQQKPSDEQSRSRQLSCCGGANTPGLSVGLPRSGSQAWDFWKWGQRGSVKCWPANNCQQRKLSGNTIYVYESSRWKEITTDNNSKNNNLLQQVKNILSLRSEIRLKAKDPKILPNKLGK